MENDQLSETNQQLEKNYESLNNQMIVYQTKLETLINEINVLNNVKGSISNQMDKIKEGSNILNDIIEFFNKFGNDVRSKVDSIKNFEEVVKNEIRNFDQEKEKLENQLKEKVLLLYMILFLTIIKIKNLKHKISFLVICARANQRLV